MTLESGSKKFEKGKKLKNLQLIIEKMAKKITCKTGLKKNIISKRVFDREIDLCRMLSKENKGGCGWGKCKDCGVIPFLVKLHNGVLLEKDDKITAARNKFLNQ